MTEVEAYEVFAIIAAHQYDLMFGYFSIVSAFLIMSYFVADKLDSFLATIAGVLYSFCCLWFAANVYGWHTDIAHLYAEIIQKKSAGVFELEWFGHNPDWLTVGNSYIQRLIIVGGWLISIIYFLFRRRSVNAGDA
jgi:galactitol-specific phosphotransferase system IIC component